jgi:hypothetical protein
MKNKKFTKTRAKLPEDERILGGDADPKFNNKRKKQFEKLFKGLKG